MPVYVVTQNDTPERVARRFSLSVGQLCRLNGLDDPRRFGEGLALFLPEEGAPPRFRAELLACPYAPLPASVRAALLPALSWWAGDTPPPEEEAALPLLRRANWDARGAWSAEEAHALLNDPQSPQRLCAETEGFCGLYLLLCGLFPFDAPALAAFVEALAGLLHRAGRYLLLALEAEEPLFFPCAQAADRVVLLSPGAAPAGALPRPNASLERLREQLETALRSLPPEQILLGLSDYGSLWRDGRVRPIPNAAAVRLALAVGAPLRWDEAAGECFFRFDDALGQPCTVWFQDLRSLRLRLELAEALGLAGLAIQPSPRLNRPSWEFLRSRCERKIIAS